MSEEMIDVEVNLGKEFADSIKGMTKKDLTNMLCVTVLRGRVQDETVDGLERDAVKLNAELRALNKSLKQAESMILGVIDTW